MAISQMEHADDRDGRRPSNISISNPRNSSKPLKLMVFALFAGAGFATALHAYYSSLNGTPVSSTKEQETSIRVGTAFAWLAQTSLVFSIQVSYVQWLWRELKGSTLSLRAVDAAFAATTDLTAFGNIEMVRTVKIASALAAVSWLIPISALFPPATLNVAVVPRDTPRLMRVPTLHVANPKFYYRFAYTVNGTVPGTQRFHGPRTICQRFALAAATTGDISTLPVPATNARYEQRFYAPSVQCGNSTDAVQKEIEGMVRRAQSDLNPSKEMVALGYFGTIPALNNLNTSAPIQAANLSEVEGALYSSNELWISLPQFALQREIMSVSTHYITCKLFNASYHVSFQFENGRQTIKILNRTDLNVVPYPTNASASPDSEVAMAYSAIASALFNPLVGSIGFYRDLNSTEAAQPPLANQIFSAIASSIAQTTLIGNSDFDSFFALHHLLSSGGLPSDASIYSDQRLQDREFAHGKSLGEMVEELAFNTTMNFLTDPITAPPAPVNVTVTVPVSIYTYQWRNVLLTYSIVCSIGILANLLGFVAWKRGGRASHNTNFSSIALSTHGLHFCSRVRAHERLAALPLAPEIARMLLRFHTGEDGRFGFGAADEHELELWQDSRS